MCTYPPACASGKGVCARARARSPGRRCDSCARRAPGRRRVRARAEKSVRRSRRARSRVARSAPRATYRSGSSSRCAPSSHCQTPRAAASIAAPSPLRASCRWRARQTMRRTSRRMMPRPRRGSSIARRARAGRAWPSPSCRRQTRPRSGSPEVRPWPRAPSTPSGRPQRRAGARPRPPHSPCPPRPLRPLRQHGHTASRGAPPNKDRMVRTG